MACSGASPNWTAPTWDDVVDCHDNRASNGDTITVSAGTYTTTSKPTLTKAVTLAAAGASTGSTIGSNNTVTINWNAGDVSNALFIQESPSGHTRITGFTFQFNVAGPSPGTNAPLVQITAVAGGKAVRFDHNSVLYTGVALPVPAKSIIFDSQRGVVDHNLFDVSNGGGPNTHYWNHISCQGSADTGNTSWSRTDTYGTHDTTGENNIYVETNTFRQSSQAFDVSDNCRIVIRYNTFDTSNILSHGWEGGVAGARHAEIYRNTWSFREPGDCLDSNQILSVGAVNMRGGSWLIHDNTIPDYAPCAGIWGNIPELNMTIQMLTRADTSPNPCWAGGFPAPHQPGQGYNGTSTFTDPIYIWNNTSMPALTSQGDCGAPGTFDQLYGCGHAPFFRTPPSGSPPCSSPPADLSAYLALSPTSPANVVFCADSSCAKPGYTEYQYPHPLVTGIASDPVVAATGVSSRQMIRIRRRHWGM